LKFVFKNIIYFTGSMVVFFAGVLLYGMFLGLKDISLSEALAAKKMRYLTNVHLVIHRRGYMIDLYSDTTVVKSYHAVFGRNSSKHKTFTDDKVTPLGKYTICRIDSVSPYQRFIKLNYPNAKDITDAYFAGLLFNREYESANNELLNNECPVIDRYKLSSIGIHGIGRLNLVFKNLPFVYNWTNGSVAVSNENIDELITIIKIGTEVEIKD